ncbi:uncharacterized protein N7483_009374 [Penicillium malachiteum]|uniref:uncharacterized protein n=1 Tax=Penicillium malachiteum TaxID=1324776 RepID=UPI002546F61B|nr:uncharacterized protein N7483_009374 [Penicillium malachiteum]KAJ5721440.1 hypothetical protein N7483_009374 [Penicillium malachiteum]
MYPDQQARLTFQAFPFMLPIPKSEDTLESTARKLDGLAIAIRNGGSLTLTNGSVSTPQRHNAEDFAKERMTDMELIQYNEWKQNTFSLPHINWEANRLPVKAASSKTFSQRAMAMNIIWGCQVALPENAAWLSNNIPDILPLVKAITKLLSAQAHLEVYDPHSRFTDQEVVEIQTLQLITATAEENVTRERERVRQLARCIQESQTVIRERLKSLKK